MPTLIHSLVDQKSSVLSLAATDKYIFSGSQNEDILVGALSLRNVPGHSFSGCPKVWNKDTFTLKTTLSGHEGSVLALEVARGKDWLFSSSGM